MNPDVSRLLLASFNGANGVVPLPYQYAISNPATGKYAVYTISAKYVQSPNGSVTTTPIFAFESQGTTASGYPPAASGCPKTDSSGSTGSGSGGTGGTGTGGTGGGGTNPGGWGGSCHQGITNVYDANGQVVSTSTSIVCP